MSDIISFCNLQNSMRIFEDKIAQQGDYYGIFDCNGNTDFARKVVENICKEIFFKVKSKTIILDYLSELGKWEKSR